MTTIDIATARALADDVLMLDVRTAAEFHTAHIAEAVHVPLDRLDGHLPRLTEERPDRIVLICQSGGRARTAQSRLAAAGLTATVLEGGMNAWLSAGAPVERGEQRWSLERQVRLVAGLLVLTSVIASLWLPWTLLITAFVGAGLTYAGASDNCLMGILLTRLPYNRDPGKACPR
ncbi:rhodanese-like domain-containing protein [Spirillospora sp. NPDC127200]